MCCEECPRYEACEENNRLKDNCCPKCPEYYDCAGTDNRKDYSSTDADSHSDYENYS